MPAMNPRLLLLEDDPVSAAFLRQALAGLPAAVEHAQTLASARHMAGPWHALWLFDAHLPDGHGGDLLRELHGRGLRVPALALTADDHPTAHARLMADGFVEVLGKPISASELRHAVSGWLAGDATDWDDAMALAALGGSREAVESLRVLFLDELPVQAGEIAAALADGDHPRAQAQLHRLKASCGFVGAAALLRSVRALSVAPGDLWAQRTFQSLARATAR